jgi:hypothetical protein
LAVAERNLARVGRPGKAGRARRTTNSSSLLAPHLSVSGQTLTWTRIANINTYVFVRKVPGQVDQYSLIRGTSITPPPVPGLTITYSIRTPSKGSAWAAEQSITYPANTGTPDTQAAPAISVSGQTLTWNAVANVNTYVFVSKVPGRADQYSEVSGTSITPPPVPGATARYSVRTAVAGSAWASEVEVSYPATPSLTPTQPTTPPAGDSFEMGAVVGSAQLYELPWLEQLGAHTARMEFAISTPVSQIEPVVEAYARAGIRPLLLAGFTGRIPSTVEAQNLANWAVSFGPGGTFWQGKSLPADTAVTDIEFGNETDNPYQFSKTLPENWQSEPAFLLRAEEYARRLEQAQIAISQTGAKVGLLGIAGQTSGYTTWIEAMFRAVPDLGQRVAGWTVHPYGPDWQNAIDNVITDTRAAGAPINVPIFVTEWGLSTDNGRCLSNNVGWNVCMTYQEAASTLASTVGAMRSRYGSRLRAFYLFQARDQQPTGASTNGEYYFGALQSNQASKGAYTTAVESLLAANP